MAKVTKEDLVTDIKDIKVLVPEEDKDVKERVIKSIKREGVNCTLYDSMEDSYSAVYGILVRKYRGYNKFAGININAQCKKRFHSYLKKAIDCKMHDSALLLLKLGATPDLYDGSNTALKECITSYWNKNPQLAYYLMKAGAETEGLERRLLKFGVEENDPLFLDYLISEKGIKVSSEVNSDMIFRYVDNNEVLKLLADQGVEMCLDDGKALLSAVKNYGNDSDREMFCFWLDQGAKFGDKRVEILNETIQKDNAKILSKILEIEEYTVEELTCNFSKINNEDILSVLWEQKGVADFIQAKDDKWFSETLEHYIGEWNFSVLETFLEEPYSFANRVDLNGLLLSAYAKDNTKTQDVLWDCKAANYDATELMNLAIEEGRWNLMKDIWKKYPDIDFTDAKQDALMKSVQLQSSDMMRTLIDEGAKVTPQMLQAAMPLQRHVMEVLVRQNPYQEQAREFYQACENKDYNAFNTLIRPYFEGDDLDWEALDDNVIVHHQGYASDRTSLRTVFNFAADTVSMVISDKTDKTMPPVVTNMGFMQITNDDDIQKAHKKLKKFGKKPPENFETGVLGLGRKKTVMKLPK